MLIDGKFQWKESPKKVEVFVDVSYRERKNNWDVYISAYYGRISFKPYIIHLDFFRAVKIDDYECNINGNILRLMIEKEESCLWKQLNLYKDPFSKLSKQRRKEVKGRRQQSIKSREAWMELEVSKRKEAKAKNKSYLINELMRVEGAERKRIEDKRNALKVEEEFETYKVLEPVQIHDEQDTHIQKAIRDKNQFAIAKDITATRTRPIRNSLKDSSEKVVTVSFTPRAFQAPMRTSKKEEEENYLLKNNIYLDHKTGTYQERKKMERVEFSMLSKQELRAMPFEERNPIWLRDKAKSFIQKEDFQSACNVVDTVLSPSFIEFCTPNKEVFTNQVTIELILTRGEALFGLKRYKEALREMELSQSKLDSAEEQMRILCSSHMIKYERQSWVISCAKSINEWLPKCQMAYADERLKKYVRAEKIQTCEGKARDARLLELNEIEELYSGVPGIEEDLKRCCNLSLVFFLQGARAKYMRISETIEGQHGNTLTEEMKKTLDLRKQKLIYCNELNFVDTEGLRSFTNLEKIPVCGTCNKTTEWKVGAFELSDRIEKRQKAERLQRRRKEKCCIVIQRQVRILFAKNLKKQLLMEKIKRRQLLKFSATKIQSAYRGRLDMRRFRTLKNLKRISNAHETVLREATKRRRGSTVFWYKRRDHVGQLYKDYRVLVQRTGFIPPLHEVEKNIQQVRNNVHSLECQKATFIQKYYRGSLGRTLMREYRIELHWLIEREYNAVFQIQMCYRMHLARMKLHELQIQKKEGELREIKLGYLVACYNPRGRGGNKLQTFFLYSAGYTEDLRYTINHVKSKFQSQNAELYAVGFSLGSSYLAKYVGEEGQNCFLKAAVSCACPLDPLSMSNHLNNNFTGRMLDKYLVRNVKNMMKELEPTWKNFVKEDPSLKVKLDFEAIAASKSMAEFDHYFTARLFDFSSGSQYYREASAAAHMHKINIPVLFVHASNDPILPSEYVREDDFWVNENLIHCVTSGGGHSMTWPQQKSFFGQKTSWIAEAVSEFLEAVQDRNGTEQQLELS
eukprot:augustus_masked-scaffold_4-processed-gene-5.6-mRNA-1 protein AED:1.00 eAED:1.00 QI:0/0/0/0/1/1/3/0/1026